MCERKRSKGARPAKLFMTQCISEWTAVLGRESLSASVPSIACPTTWLKLSLISRSTWGSNNPRSSNSYVAKQRTSEDQQSPCTAACGNPEIRELRLTSLSQSLHFTLLSLLFYHPPTGTAQGGQVADRWATTGLSAAITSAGGRSKTWSNKVES